MKKNIQNAAKLYMKAYRCIKKAEELLESEGIHACSNIEGSYEDICEPEVQIYSGIRNMTDMEHSLADRPPIFHTYKPRKDDAWLKLCGVNFFQPRTPSGYTLK